MTILSLEPKYKVQLAVEKKKHFYDVFTDSSVERTHRFPGVTGFLDVINKPALINWAKKEALAHVHLALFNRLNECNGASIILDHEWIEAVMKEATKRPDKIKDDAADLGTRVHAFIDLIIHGKEPEDVPEELAVPVSAFRDWWQQSGIELVLGDTKVASLLHGYGGSLDALGRRKGQFIILDWKTSNGIYSEYALQVAAYSQAFFETYGVYCQEGIIVRFGKKLPIDFETKEIRDLESSFQAFLSAKRLKECLGLEQFLEVL